MMTIPNQLPIPQMPDLSGDQAFYRLHGYLRTVMTRLTSWVTMVAQAQRAQVFEPVPCASTGSPTEFTCPYLVDQTAQGKAMALLIADGVPLVYVSGAPAAGEWTIVEHVKGTQTITLGAVPTASPWFAYLMVRL